MKVAGLILAGGQALRMGGVDKGLQLLDSKPLVQHVIERIAIQVDGLWVCANRHLEQYQSLGYPVFSDDTTVRGMGPLAGIASFEQYLPSEFTHVQIVPCDTPFLPIGFCELLEQGMNTICAFRSFTGGVFPQSECGAQYGCALITRAQLALAKLVLKEQQNSLQSWLTRAHAVPINNFMESDFVNINTTDQLTNAHLRHHLFEASHV